MGVRDVELEALLARLGIHSPAPKAPQAQGYASLGSSPRLDVLGTGFATPARPASAGPLGSQLATAAGRTAGARASQPSPSLLDKYLPGAARPDLGPSRLGAAAAAPATAAPSLLGGVGKLGTDPLATYFSPRAGSSGAMQQQAGTPLPGVGGPRAAAAYGWDPPLTTKAGAAPYSTPTGRQVAPGGEFSIAALHRSTSDAAARASSSNSSSSSDLSISLRISAMQGTAAGSTSAALRGPSRLGAVGSGSSTPVGLSSFKSSATAAEAAVAAMGPPSWTQSPRTAVHPLASQSSSSLTAFESSSSTLDAQGALYREQEAPLGTGSVASGRQSAYGDASMLGNAGASTECNILQSRVHELQAQLRLKDLEQQKTASKIAELQEQQDELRGQLHRSGAEVANWQRRCRHAEALQLEQQQAAAELREALQSREGAHSTSTVVASRLQGELEAERSGAEALRMQLRQAEKAAEQRERESAQLRAALHEGDRISASELAALRQQMEDLVVESKHVWGQYQNVQMERLASQKQAEMAAERCRQAEERCQRLERELLSVESGGAAKDGRLEEAQRQVASLQQRAKDMSDQLAAANEQCQLAQATLAEEQRSAAQQREQVASAQRSEAALAAQVQSMAEQIQELQSEAAALREDNAHIRQQLLEGQNSVQEEFVALEEQVASLQEENRQLQAEAQKAASELAGKVQLVEEQRGLLKQLRDKTATLQEVAHSAEAQLNERCQQAAVLQAQVEDLAAGSAQLQQELQESKARAAELEVLLAKSSARPSGQASPLGGLVASMRAELQERELALVALGEELATEKRAAAELQRQVWDQAVELDELQRKQSEDFSLGQQLAAARQAEAQLRKRVGELSQALAAAQRGGGRAGGGDASPAGIAAGGAGRPTASNLARTGSGRVPQRAGGSPGSGRSSSPSRPSSRTGSPRPTAAVSRSDLTPLARAGGQQQGQEQVAGGAGVLPGEEAEALRREVSRLRRENGRLAAEAEAREGEVMHLQGQVRILQSQATEAENWLTS